MVRSLTNKERIYLKRLVDRNYKLIKAKKATQKDWLKPIGRPMLAKERMLRMRIRRKAEIMAIDLCTIYQAGVLPSKKLKQNTASGLVRDIGMALTIARM